MGVRPLNIYEIAEKFAISVAKLRKMERDGCLRVDGEDSETAAALRHYLARNQQMTVAQIMSLLDSPALYIELGKWADRARTQVAALGDVKATAAPRDVTAYIDDAARGDSEAVEILMRWLHGVLPAKPVPHSWIAARLLINLPENLRASFIKRIPIALLNVRKQPEFAGWWTLAPTGAKDRNQTFYQKAKIALDL
jgi:hypothetical protein